jgi:hypothetical protein
VAKSFAEWIEGAPFCGYRILLYKWERAAVTAKTDRDRAKLEAVHERLRNELMKERRRERMTMGWDSVPPPEPVVQTNADRYAGPLIEGRFQVMGSWIGGTYYVADHARDDLLTRVSGPASETRRFATVSDAEDFIKMFTTGAEASRLRKAGSSATEEYDDMGKPVVVKETSAKAPVKVPAKVAAALDSMRTKVNGAKAAAPKKEAAPKAAKVKTAVEATGAPKVGARTKELILAGLDNNAIVAKLQAEFPDKANSASNVNWYRNALRKSGELTRPKK